MTKKLKPCPLCGGEAEIITDAVGQSFVMCMMCGFGSSEAVLDKEALAKQWNTRYEPKREFVVNPEKKRVLPEPPKCRLIENGKEIK